MSHTSPPSRFLVYLVFLPALLLGAKESPGCSCRHDPPSVEPPVADGLADLAAVQEPLQVVSVSPSVAEAGQGFRLRIDGAGFTEEATAVVLDAAGQAIPVQQLRFADGNTLRGELPGLGVGRYDIRVRQGESVAALRQGLVVRDAAPDISRCSHVLISFGTDDANLSDAARRQLDGLADCFGGLARIRVEGHADERGTTSYNLGLGQRRAHTVSRYLIGLGVDLTKQELISYGEEHPVAAGHDEAAWTANRRVELVGE